MSRHGASMLTRKLIATAGVALAALAATAYWWQTSQQPLKQPSAQRRDASLLEERSMGSASAPITVFEASDFQCPFCRQFWQETLPALEREYIQTGKVRLTFLNLPIPELHPNAPAAHEFAMCAAEQDRFWRVHDLLYAHQATWARMDKPGPYFLTLADSAGLSRDSLLSCFQSGAVRQLIQNEAQLTFKAGVSSTPSFVIEGGLLSGFAPIQEWRPILDSIYAAKTGG